MTKLVNLFKLHKPIVFSYMIALFLLVTVGIFRPEFVSGSHLRVIASQAAMIGIISLGQTLVIIVGGVDLSIPWTLTSAAILVTNLNGGKESTLVLVIPAILFGALLVGFINGIGVAYLEINPIIMTFGVNTILLGALIGATRGTPGNYCPEVISRIVNGSIVGVPNLLIFWIVIIIVITIVLVKTPFGRYLCATGTNPAVAFLSGINVKNVKIAAYCISSLSAAIGGIIMAGKVNQSYLGMGDYVMFQTIAAVVVGGTLLTGGKGSYIGTVAGAFILTILSGLLSAFRMPASMQQIMYGLVLLAAVFLLQGREKLI